MALQGTFQDFGLPDIFQLISLQRKTGVLMIRSEREAIRIVFYEGHIIEADSEPRRFEDRLGQVLVRTGVLTQEQLDKALAHQTRTLKRLGLVLLELDFVDEKTLKQALETQISQTVFRTFRWKSGEYSFETRDDIQYDPRIDVMLSTDNVLMEGIQIVDEWPVIQRRIPDFNMVFRPAIDPTTIQLETTKDELDFSFGLETKEEEPGEVAQGVTMNPDEFKVFSMIDGRRSVQEILDRVPLPEFPTLKILYDFYTRGLIEPVRASQQLTEVVIEETPAEKAVHVDYMRYASLGLGALAAVAFFFGFVRPFHPYRVPVQQPAYGIHIDICSQLVRFAELGYYLLNESWSSSTETVTPDPIIGNCLKDPYGRPAQLEVTASEASIRFLDSSGSPSVAVRVPRPIINQSVLQDPLEGLVMRPVPPS